MKRFLITIAIAAAIVAAVSTSIVLAVGWSAERLSRGWLIGGAIFAGLGAMSFTGGTTQSGLFGGGSMGRGHELLAETHALGPDGHLKRQADDRAGRVGFAWIALLAGAAVIGAGALLGLLV
ncbi:MAG TPA: hypothetical protein VGB64_00925 [Actinomycetota bacterium]